MTAGESLIVNAMQHFGRLTVQGREALLSRDWAEIIRVDRRKFRHPAQYL